MSIITSQNYEEGKSVFEFQMLYEMWLQSTLYYITLLNEALS